MHETCYVACDLGAGSGRVIIGRLDAGSLSLEEIHRFTSPPVKWQGTLRWDIVQIFSELKMGLRKVAESGAAPASLSVDSWGVDYVLAGVREPMLSLPYSYRDARTDRPFAEALKNDAELIFGETGIQFLPFNTLYQLIAEMEQNAGILAASDKFLTIADFLNFLFSGVARIEESMASTTQIYDSRARAWSRKLIARFGLPGRIFPEIVPSGTRLGPLLPALCEEIGLGALDVVATCSHDTGAAVAAVPAGGNDWAFLSSGTWSLIGVELPEPLINDDVRAENFTNEGGHGGATRFLKNIAGMWLLQECEREWRGQGLSLGYDELARLAGEAEPFRCFINPNSGVFAKPGGMPARIVAHCRESGQPVPEAPGQFVRCIYESLALLYREMLGKLDHLTGRAIRRLHVVGGGSQSALLNQFTADACGIPVLAGPVEATAAGNILIQAISLGHVASLQAGRDIVRGSFPIREFTPASSAEWDAAFDRFRNFSIYS